MNNENIHLLASFFKALGDENRLRIIFALKSSEKSVSQIVQELGLSQPLVSHHLRELRYNQIVSVRKEGPFIYYRLKRPEIIDIIIKAQTLLS